MQRVLRGVSAADGVALGFAYVVRDTAPAVDAERSGADEVQIALGALSAVASDLRERAAFARERGRDEVADILDTSGLIADDSVLREEVCELARRLTAEAAITRAIGDHAARLEALPDRAFAAHAGDVREVGRRAVRALSRAAGYLLPPSPTVVFARDLGPADVTEFHRASGTLLGFAVAAGAASSHAAIISRALGLPFVVGLGPEALTLADGECVCLDGNDGLVIVDPDDEIRRRARTTGERATRLRRTLRGFRPEGTSGTWRPVQTTDGRAVELLCNVNRVADVRAGLAAGAPGVGLLRTEVAFLDACTWPTEEQHRAALEPIIGAFSGRTVTARTLDFGFDKTPPFLEGVGSRGLELTLRHPEAFLAQLKAILRTGRDVRLRILFPLVQTPAELERAEAILHEALEAVEWIGPAPVVGAMIETPAAVDCAAELAERADFLALGTNDLVRFALEPSRAAMSACGAADPRVLSLIARTIDAAHAQGVLVEACGEAAGEPAIIALLVGLGIDELSVTPRRIDLARWVVRSISARESSAAARAALEAGSVEEARALAREVISGGESPDELREVRDGLGGVLT
jgi:phosphoenolpyruvate-protein kinase (PTS system EI component)